MRGNSSAFQGPVTNGRKTDDLLHAYIDNMLPPRQRLEVEEYLAGHPDAAQRVADFEAQNQELHRLYDRRLAEPLPARLQELEAQLARKLSRPDTPRVTLKRTVSAVVAVLALGGGWYGFNALFLADIGSPPATVFKTDGTVPAVPVAGARMPRDSSVQTATAGLPETATPDLTRFGFALIRTRLIGGTAHPKTVQLVYESNNGAQVLMYLSPAAGNAKRQISLTQEGRISILFWSSGGRFYNLIGEVDRDTMLAIGAAVSDNQAAIPALPQPRTDSRVQNNTGHDTGYAAKDFIRPAASPAPAEFKQSDRNIIKE